ncbi:MAG: VOC family protein [Actinomycetota bacterium]|nr:VOC family protein [Actinomycetota bacterium]
MSKQVPRLAQVNLIVEDMDAAVEFYQRLGMTVRFDGGEWPAGSGARHVALENGDGAIFEIDNLAMARIYHSGWRATDAAVPPVVVNFYVASREAVDESYRALTAEGYSGRQEPYDAFFGARYAVVSDPAGNDVGLMSPIDQHKRFTPKT